MFNSANIFMYLLQIKEYCNTYALDRKDLEALNVPNSKMQLKNLSSLYKPPKLCDCYQKPILAQSYSDLMLPYLTALLDSIYNHISKNESITHVSFLPKQTGSLEAKIALFLSDYGSLLLSSKESLFITKLSKPKRKHNLDNNGDADDDKNNTDSSDDDNGSNIDIHRKYSVLGHIRPVVKLYCSNRTSPLTDAVLKNIKWSPDILPFARYWKDENRAESISIADVRSKHLFINVFQDKFLQALLAIGGPSVVAYYQWIIDPSYENPNYNKTSHDPTEKIYKTSSEDKPIQNACQFYTRTYKTYLKNNHDSLWDYFLIETVLNGATLFSFSTRLSGKGAKHLPEELTYEQADKVYYALLDIENPFIKHDLITSVMHKTFYQEFNYEGNLLPAGKQDPDQWVTFIKNYCCRIAQLEQKIYPTFLSYRLNHGAPTLDEKEEAKKSYKNLFAHSNIFPAQSEKSIYFYPLLRIALHNNRYYYFRIFQNSYLHQK